MLPWGKDRGIVSTECEFPAATYENNTKYMKNWWWDSKIFRNTEWGEPLQEDVDVNHDGNDRGEICIL